jgi:hypothetical protein
MSDPPVSHDGKRGGQEDQSVRRSNGDRKAKHLGVKASG